MPGTIDGIACSRVIGFGREQAERSQVWQVAGVDGYGIHLLGAGDSENEFRAVFFGTTAGCNTWYDSIRATQGTIVTIVNEQLESFSNQFIQAVSSPKRTTANNLATTTTRFEVAIKTITV